MATRRRRTGTPATPARGAIGEGRLVFPIPPGTHWSEVQAVALPDANGEQKALGSDAEMPSREKKTRKPIVPSLSANVITGGGLRFATPEPVKDRAKRERRAKPKVKIDPQLVSKARELRDRYLEHVNDQPLLVAPRGKYDVSRALEPIKMVPRLAG